MYALYYSIWLDVWFINLWFQRYWHMYMLFNLTYFIKGLWLNQINLLVLDVIILDVYQICQDVSMTCLNCSKLTKSQKCVYLCLSLVRKGGKWLLMLYWMTWMFLHCSCHQRGFFMIFKSQQAPSSPSWTYMPGFPLPGDSANSLGLTSY